MPGKVYINKLSKFLPNEVVTNDEMEDYLGLVKNKKSRAKGLILRSNGIKKRYYSIDKEGNHTHTNAEMAAQAIRGLKGDDFTLNDIELLALGTTSPDQLLPAHAQMVQGLLKNRPLEAITPEGSCNSSLLAMKYAYMSVLTGNTQNAVSGGSERFSPWLLSKNFEDEATRLQALQEKQIVAFEKDFLRWMLSDGAAVALLENKPNKDDISLEINWIEVVSYSNELASCMYAGGVRTDDGQLIPWRNFSPEDLLAHGILSIRQDVKLLDGNIVKYGAQALKDALNKHNVTTEEVDFFLPHMSSEFFRDRIQQETNEIGCFLDPGKWFTNLTEVGNVGSASAYLMLEELFYSGKLKKGDKVLIMSPESARFSYAFVFMTVV
jgi:3-oxoacyl-[acyl-carrier-protein] synthase-3